MNKNKYDILMEKAPILERKSHIGFVYLSDFVNDIYNCTNPRFNKELALEEIELAFDEINDLRKKARAFDIAVKKGINFYLVYRYKGNYSDYSIAYDNNLVMANEKLTQEEFELLKGLIKND